MSSASDIFECEPDEKITKFYLQVVKKISRQHWSFIKTRSYDQILKSSFLDEKRKDCNLENHLNRDW